MMRVPRPIHTSSPSSINLGVSESKPVSLPKVTRLWLALYEVGEARKSDVVEIARKLGYSEKELQLDLGLLKILKLVEEEGDTLRITAKSINEIEKLLKSFPALREELEFIRRLVALNTIANEMGWIRFRECLHDSQCFEDLRRRIQGGSL